METGEYCTSRYHSLGSRNSKIGIHGYVLVFNDNNQRVLGLTWRPRQMSFFVDQKPEDISKNDSNTGCTNIKSKK